jgi:hypothetical protein
MNAQINKPLVDNKLPLEDRMNARRSLLLISRNLKTILDNGQANLTVSDKAFSKKAVVQRNRYPPIHRLCP